MTNNKPYIVIPNWNGADRLASCLDSAQAQTVKPHIVVVDNGSSDNSLELLENKFPEVEVVGLKKNRGFAGGVNAGIKNAIAAGAKFVVLLNNDAVADKKWLENLQKFMDKNPHAGIATSKILEARSNRLDSTGECYTVWGLSYPRGRGEANTDRYDDANWIFGASGGASMYRIEMLEQIGLFDEDLFAYYEDVDISFRAQLAGWKVAYVPHATIRHQIGATSGKIKGFTTYHTLKNLPLVLWKNVPWALMPRIWPRLAFAYTTFVGRAIARGQIIIVLKALFMGSILWPKKLLERSKIQRNRKVSAKYIDSIITHDLPPSAKNLRTLRSRWWSLTRGRHE